MSIKIVAQSNLREFSDNMPLNTSMVTVILIKKGSIQFATGVWDKRNLAAQYKKGDRLIAVWVGQWRSDAFDLPIEELKKV